MIFGLDDRLWMLFGSLLYAGAFVFAVAVLRGRRAQPSIGFNVLLIGGFTLQSLGLYARGLEDQAFPVINYFEVLQVIGWTAILLDLILRSAFHLRYLDVLASALAGGVGLLALAVPAWDFAPRVPEPVRNPWTEFHAVLAVFSYAIFAILALVSLMYIIQHFALEHRKAGGFFARLPAIRQLEEASSRLITMGVIVLTVSVAIGYLNYIESAGKVGLTKLVIASAVWLAYAVVLILRRRNELIAAPFAWSCFLLFVFAMASLRPLTLDDREAATPTTPPADQTGHE